MLNESDSEPINPYAAPHSISEVVTSSTSSSPPYRLYSVGAIALATFLGSLLGGGVLMAIDFSRVGRTNASRLTLALAIVTQIALFAIIWVLPDNLPRAPFLIPQLLVMWFIAEQSLGSLLRAHERARGKYASLWKAAGIGLACCLLELFLVFLVAMLLAATDEGLLIEE